MRKMEALWAYQEAEIAKNAVEAEIRSTPARLQLNKLHKQLKNQQAVIAKLSEDIEAYEQQLPKLTEQVEKLEARLEVESGELVTIRQDDESTAEEMTELKVDIEHLNREIAQGVRETRSLLAEIEKATEEFQSTVKAASKAKKEYDTLRVTCEEEKEARADELAKHDQNLAALAKTVDPRAAGAVQSGQAASCGADCKDCEQQMRRVQYVASDGHAEKNCDDGRHCRVRKLRKNSLLRKRLEHRQSNKQNPI